MRLLHVLTLFSLVVALMGSSSIEDDSSSSELLINEEQLQELMKYQDDLRTWINRGLNGGGNGNDRATILCPVCKTAVGIAINMIHAGNSKEQIANSVIFVCVSLNIVARDVCVGAVNTYIDPLLWMFDKKPWMNVNDTCGFILAEEECAEVNATMTEWDVNVDVNKKPIVLYPRLPAGIPTVKVVHLTDIHPDLHYTEGSLTDCGKPLCCRPSENDDPSNSSIAAGPWGDYACDLPARAMVNVLEEIATRHSDAEFVLMTGDLVHHQIWNTTISDNIDHFNAFNSALRTAFGNKTVYPNIGNHEPHPCNMFPTSDLWNDPDFPEHDVSYVYNTMADAYGQHLTPEALVTFRRAGYYTIVHKPGFRLIFLNTNFCYVNNFWLLYDAADPEDQLQWLADTLLIAERADEQVWIVGHVPPGSGDCWPVWSNKFLAVIDRFETRIKAQFYGHTHNDDFRVFFDATANPPRPINSLYIGASATPHTNLNPGYKVFYADGVNPQNATWEITDHETWIYNLTLANLGQGDPTAVQWFKLYSAKEEFGLLSFRPVDLYDFVVRMVTDDALFQKFYRFYHKAADGIGPCDSVCKMSYLCDIVKTDYDRAHCDRLEAIRQNHLRQLKQY